MTIDNFTMVHIALAKGLAQHKDTSADVRLQCFKVIEDFQAMDPQLTEAAIAAILPMSEADMIAFGGVKKP